MFGIIFKLLILVVFLLIAFGVFVALRSAFKVVDHLEVEEQKNNINHKASLVDEVEDFKSENSEAIEKASSSAFNEFTNS